MSLKPKVVVVDDEPFMARAIAAVLEEGGFEVAICEEWAGVAHMVRTEQPDLVLLDYNMPMVKGDSICTILKRNDANSRMKIVLFSSESPAELVAIAQACGADAVIAKNTAPADVVNRVRLLIAATTTAFT